MNNRADNVEIFRDTEKHCKEDAILKESLKKSTENQKFFGEDAVLQVPDRKTYPEPAKVVVSTKRSYEAASAYAGQQICVHNFASASNPGGGVVNGATAQEECLCRCSTLYFCLNTPEMWSSFYTPHRAAHDPIHNGDCIYTPGVTVFKSDTASPALLPKDQWYPVNVLTCAAPNLRENPSNPYNSGDGSRHIRLSKEKLLEIHKQRLTRILDIALAEGNEVVILGAFGCGAFQNDPQVVAQAAKIVLKDYLHAFRTIEFAVYCSPRDERNYRIFKDTLAEYTC